MSRKNLNRYLVRDGYAYFTGDPTKQQNIQLSGEILTLTDEQIEKGKQAYKLEKCEAVLVKCDNCGKDYVTKVVQIQHAVCTHCRGRGGDLVGPVPRDWRDKDAEPDNAGQSPAPDGEGTSAPAEGEAGDSGKQAGDLTEKNTTMPPADLREPAAKPAEAIRAAKKVNKTKAEKKAEKRGKK